MSKARVVWDGREALGVSTLRRRDGRVGIAETDGDGVSKARVVWDGREALGVSMLRRRDGRVGGQEALITRG